MDKKHKDNTDILDDEIRFISPGGKPSSRGPKARNSRLIWLGLAAGIIIIVLALVLIFFVNSSSEAEESEMGEARISETSDQPDSEDLITELDENAAPYTSLADTIINGRKLTILKPIGGVAKLVIGDSILDIEGPVLVAQAADVRRDNGQIVGAYVINGDMKSRGKAKSGFCAIINNEITIGVAQTTPLLERATEENGFFFRQYPLVYEGEVIENKPKNLSQRKALAILNDEVVIVLSEERLSFSEFSQALVGLGIKNAIYLTGSAAYLKAKLEDGQIYEFGKRAPNCPPNTNYIYWQ